MSREPGAAAGRSVTVGVAAMVPRDSWWGTMSTSVSATSTTATTLTAVVSAAMRLGRSRHASTATATSTVRHAPSSTSRDSAQRPCQVLDIAVREPDDHDRRGDERAPAQVAQQHPREERDADGDRGRPQDGLVRLAHADLGQVLGEQEQDRIGGEQQGWNGNGRSRERRPVPGWRPPGVLRRVRPTRRPRAAWDVDAPASPALIGPVVTARMMHRTARACPRPRGASGQSPEHPSQRVGAMVARSNALHMSR